MKMSCFHQNENVLFYAAASKGGLLVFAANFLYACLPLHRQATHRQAQGEGDLMG